LLRTACPSICLGLLLFLVAAAPAALAQTGTIAGVVVDSDTGETLIGVNVLVDGTGLGAATGLDGDYRIASVPAGTYDLVFSYLGYDTQRVTGVAVASGATTTIDLALTEEALELEGGEVVVEAEAIRSNEAALLKDRQKSAAVSDAISAETISKSGSSDAADAMERVTGASVQGGQYVFVRGLGDRYANTQLNGAVLPTADPDRRAVQFDLFPSSFLENIVTLKTFTPDKPGSFSGGLVDISTKSFPGAFSASLSASTGFTSQAIPGEAYLVDPVQGASPFRFGAGDLAMPDLLAGTTREDFLAPTSLVEGPDGAQVLVRDNAAASQRLNDLSNALPAQIAPVEGTLPLNGSVGLTLGNQIPLGRNLLGFVVSATADQGVSTYDEGTLGRIEVQGLSDDAGNPTGAFSVDTTTVRTDRRSTREAKLGGLANVAFRLGAYNEFNLNTLFSHTTESEARVLDGVDNILSNGARVVDQVAGYEERMLASAQLRGRHNIPQLGGAEVAWRGNYSNTRLDQPDLRFFAVRTQEREDEEGNVSEVFTASGTPPGPQRYFRDLDETLGSGAVDVTVPVRFLSRGAEVKVGGLVEQTDRAYNERFFFYQLNNRAARLGGISGDSIAAYLAPENVGIVDTRDQDGDGVADRYEFGHFLIDATRDQNSYDGTFDVGAGYAMVEVPLGRLRAIVGARYEASSLTVATGALAQDDTPADSVVTVDGQDFLGTDRTYNDLLPALNLVYALSDDMNLRAAATRTLARPTFREVAPVATFDFASDGALLGNPALERTLITNLDLRWEWFNGPGRVLAVSGYYKDLENPIERVIIDPENGSTSFANVEQAQVLGAEFELRQPLRSFGLGGVLGERLSLGANLSVARSSITITERELAARRAVDPGASDTRDLQGQSPYLFNANLSYEDFARGTTASVFFNIAGRRLSRVGNPLPDVYEASAPQLDLVVSQAFFDRFVVKATAKNLLNASYREVYDIDQDVVPFLEYSPGTSFSIGITFSPGFGIASPAAPAVPAPSISGSASGT
jgi:TonB-dependent receptor